VKSHLITSKSAAATFRIVAITLVCTLGMVTMAPSVRGQEPAPAPAPASENTEGGNASSAGMGAAAGLSTLLYLPLKAAFAIGGGVVGGLAYAFSGGNENAAKSIWTTSMYGTYIITPEHLRGDKPIRFLGVPEPDSAQASAPDMEPVR
jgi:hypothetical protein